MANLKNLTASFEIKCLGTDNGDTIQLVIHKTQIVAEAKNCKETLYEEIFDMVSNKLKSASKSAKPTTKVAPKKSKKVVKKSSPKSDKDDIFGGDIFEI